MQHELLHLANACLGCAGWAEAVFDVKAYLGYSFVHSFNKYSLRPLLHEYQVVGMISVKGMEAEITCNNIHTNAYVCNWIPPLSSPCMSSRGSSFVFCPVSALTK